MVTGLDCIGSLLSANLSITSNTTSPLLSLRHTRFQMQHIFYHGFFFVVGNPWHHRTERELIGSVLKTSAFGTPQTNWITLFPFVVTFLFYLMCFQPQWCIASDGEMVHK
jgi:hypothetical protein